MLPWFFQGKFPEAELEFIKAGKPKEAVLMWVVMQISFIKRFCEVNVGGVRSDSVCVCVCVFQARP